MTADIGIVEAELAQVLWFGVVYLYIFTYLWDGFLYNTHFKFVQAHRRSLLEYIESSFFKS